LMARDGVWRLAGIPKDLSPDNSIQMNGASRSDLAVRCNAPSEIRIDRTVVATMDVNGTGDGGLAHPYADELGRPWYAKRPVYLRDLLGVPEVNTEVISMGARSIGGSKFDASTPTLTLPATHTQEWTIKGATNHPFHLHVYHMQTTYDCGDFEAGEYYDTIDSGCVVRLDLNDNTGSVFDGGTVMHCHVLAHEDQGAMGWIDVVGGKAPPSYPAGTDYSLYYQLGGVGDPPLAPSSLVASAVSSSQIDLNWVDNASDETNYEVERSLDDVNFSLVPPPLGANVTSYSDSGLAASTAYFYRVRATNANGASDYSNIASATTQSSGGTDPTVMSVDSVTVDTANVGRGQKVGRAVVVVVDDQGSPVAGAEVTGDFSGTTFNEPGRTGTTDADGSATIDTLGTAKKGISFTFCVTGITHSTLTYAGPEVCGSL